MTRLGVASLLCVIWLALAFGHGWAESGIVLNRDGTSGTLTPLGDGDAIYSDAHGQAGTITHLNRGVASHTFSSAHGNQPALMVPLDGLTTPTQPTPAPVLPFHRRGLMQPGGQSSPSIPVPSSGTGSSGTYGGSGLGRIGR